MKSKIKDKLINFAQRTTAFLAFSAGFSGVMEAQEGASPEPDSLQNKMEIVKTPIEQPQDSATVDFPVSVQKDSVKEELFDSISKDPAKKRICLETYRAATDNDSIIAERRAKLDAAKEYMVYLIANFEGFKCKAYWDPLGKCYSYGIGNCERADGKKVRAGDMIKSEEEGIAVVMHHIDENMADDMIKYLPLERMSEVETAALGCLLYNTGSGKLRTKTNAPSELSDIATIHFLFRTDESEKEFREKFLSYKRTRSGSTVLLDRRQSEYAILSGEVELPIEKLKGTMLGALHGCHGDAEKINERFAPDSKFACPTDSLHYAMKQDLARTYVRKSTSSKAKGTQARGRAQPRPRSHTR